LIDLHVRHLSLSCCAYVNPSYGVQLQGSVRVAAFLRTLQWVYTLLHLHSTHPVQCSTAQCSTVQYSTVHSCASRSLFCYYMLRQLVEYRIEDREREREVSRVQRQVAATAPRLHFHTSTLQRFEFFLRFLLRESQSLTSAITIMTSVAAALSDGNENSG